MKRWTICFAALALVAMGAYAVLAGNQRCSQPCGPSAKSASSSCGPAKGAGTVACENPQGNLTGNFDPAMSGACRFSCATKLEHSAKEVLAQPGAKAGKLTQCPVSGVVFAVDASRPHVHIANVDYVTCCDKCAQKLKANPKRYLKV